MAILAAKVNAVKKLMKMKHIVIIIYLLLILMQLKIIENYIITMKNILKILEEDSVLIIIYIQREVF